MDEELKKHYEYRKEIIAKNALSIPKGSVVFFGDSITEICDLKRFYKGINAFNAGISGDSSLGLLNRIKDNVLVTNPKLVVLLCGINDIGLENRTVEETLFYYKKIVQILFNNNIKVIVQSVYPVSKQIDVPQEKIMSLNDGIKNIAKEYNYEYADIFSRIFDVEKGEIYSNLTEDGLHPNDAGYTKITPIILDFIKNVIDE